MVSGSNIIQGCEEEDQQAGIAREFSFRLKLNSKSNKQNVPGSSSTNDGNVEHAEEEDETKISRYLCLATDTEGSLNKWINTIAISSQTPDKVNLIWFCLSLCFIHFIDTLSLSPRISINFLSS